MANRKKKDGLRSTPDLPITTEPEFLSAVSPMASI